LPLLLAVSWTNSLLLTRIGSYEALPLLACGGGGCRLTFRKKPVIEELVFALVLNLAEFHACYLY